MLGPTSRRGFFGSKRRLFLSYAREDHETVANLYRKLKTSGYDPWMDTESIPPGADWAKEIEAGIRGADYFLACLSTQSIDQKTVLQDEIRTALQIWRSKPDSEVYLIPVRLEKCEIPPSLAKLQWVDLFALDGWEKLLKVLGGKQRSWLRWTAALLIAAVAGVALYRATGRETTAEEAFVRLRRGPKPPASRGSGVLVGLTAWELRAPRATDPLRSRAILHPPPTAANLSPEPEEYTPVRIPLEGSLRTGMKFWLGIESSRNGYLYVVDRELGESGRSLGDPVLVFPTGRIRSGSNQVSGGVLIRLPGESANPPYWVLGSKRGDYLGELVTILLAPQPLPELQGKPDQAAIDGAWLAQREKMWPAQATEVFRGESGGFAAPSELGPSPALGQSDPAPENIYRIEAKPDHPVVLSVPIRIKR
ncbi:MAG: toll/interleukin-1 receptor domain-containing protein [Bryobacteraceae bacterium]